MNRRLLSGAAPEVEELHGALVSYGHFTTMQVRGLAVQGFDLHLQRLNDATRELFACDLDARSVRDAIHRALAAQANADCTLRVTVFMRAVDRCRRDASDGVTRAGAPAILITTRAADAHDLRPLRVRSYRHERVLPHIKHVGTFASHHYRRHAMQAGFDDALFVDSCGLVLEGAFWNIGFWRDGRVIWPEAPALRGTCERLLQAGLTRLGIEQSTQPVERSALAGFDAAFICNARGVRPVGDIDGVAASPSPELHGLLVEALATQPWQQL
ncbi:MAG: aminotransferase class IV [Luteimonas sp.]